MEIDDLIEKCKWSGYEQWRGVVYSICVVGKAIDNLAKAVSYNRDNSGGKSTGLD